MKKRIRQAINNLLRLSKLLEICGQQINYSLKSKAEINNGLFACTGYMVQNYTCCSKTKAGASFWKSHCATCSPVCVILYHVTWSCKGPIGLRDTEESPCPYLATNFYNNWPFSHLRTNKSSGRTNRLRRTDCLICQRDEHIFDKQIV